MKKLDSGVNYVRYAVGDVHVIALRDGYVDMPLSRLRQANGRPFGSDLPARVELVNGKLRLSVNAFLLIEQEERILIDTGAANAWEPTMGLMLDALNEAGVARTDITTVAVTHTHEDHVHGLVAADGSDAFPNLERLFIPLEEVPAFDEIGRLSRFRRRHSPVRDGLRLSPHITSLPAHGHEVGHTAYEVSSASDDCLLIWGDIIHVPSIQFSRPELTWEYDADQAEARKTRLRILRRVAQPGFYVAGAHLPFPGVGTVAESGEAYRFNPL